MKPCRECQRVVSEQALACPNCGAPHPAKAHWDGWGFEYKSAASLFGLPLLHVSFKFGPDRRPVPARGVIAIGQFAIGVFTLAQFGVGLVGVCQFAVAGYALAQFAFAYSLIAQFGIYVNSGRGQMLRQLGEVLPWP